MTIAWSSSKVKGAGRLFQKTAKPTATRANPNTQIPKPTSPCVDWRDPFCFWDVGFGIWDLLRATPLVQHLIDAGNRGFLKPRAVDGAVVLAMGAEVDSLRRLGDGHFLVVKGLRLIPEVAQERLEIRDLFLAFERLSVPGHHGFEVERLQLLQVDGPLIVKAEVQGAGHRTLEEVTCRDNLLLWQVHNHVCIAVSAPQIEESNLAVAAEHRHVIVERH